VGRALATSASLPARGAVGLGRLVVRFGEANDGSVAGQRDRGCRGRAHRHDRASPVSHMGGMLLSGAASPAKTGGFSLTRTGNFSHQHSCGASGARRHVKHTHASGRAPRALRAGESVIRIQGLHLGAQFLGSRIPAGTGGMTRQLVLARGVIRVRARRCACRASASRRFQVEVPRLCNHLTMGQPASCATCKPYCGLPVPPSPHAERRCRRHAPVASRCTLTAAPPDLLRRASTSAPKIMQWPNKDKGCNRKRA